MLIDNPRVLGYVSLFLVGLMIGILFEDLKSLRVFAWGYCFRDLADFGEIVFRILAGRGIGFLKALSYEIQKIFMVDGVVVIFDTDCATLLHLGEYIFRCLERRLISVAWKNTLFFYT